MTQINFSYEGLQFGSTNMTNKFIPDDTNTGEFSDKYFSFDHHNEAVDHFA